MALLLQRLRLNRWERMRSVLATSAIALADQCVVSGLGFATSILIGRYSTEMLGLYFLAMSIVFFARGIQESLITAPFKVYCHRHDDESLAGYAGSSLAQHFALTIFISISLVGIGLLPAQIWMPVGLRPVLFMLAITLPLISLRELFRQLSFARLRFFNALAIDFCVASTQLIGLYWLASTEQLTVPRVYSVIAVACGFASIGWLLTARQRLRFERSRTLADLKRNWSFGRWAVAAQVVGFFAPYVIPWILSFARGAGETGLFAACMTLVGASRVVTDAVFNILTPKSAQVFHQSGRHAMLQMIVQWGSIIAWMMGGFALFIIVFGEPILLTVYGPDYAGTRLTLALLAIALWIHAIGYACGSGLYVLERTKDNFWADVISTVLTLIVSAPLVIYWGINGAAMATLVALGSGALARFFILRRCLQQLECHDSNSDE